MVINKKLFVGFILAAILAFVVCFIFILRPSLVNTPQNVDDDTQTNMENSATITIDMDKETAIEYKMRGLNNPISNSLLKYNHPEFIEKSASLKLGYVRWGGGGPYFNVKTGLTDNENMEQGRLNDENYIENVDFRKAEWASGRENLADFKEFLRRIGSKAIIPINGLTGNVETAMDLAKYVKDNNIPVIYWELSNEPYYWQGKPNTRMFSDAEDYLNKMKPYNDAIKSVLPNAKTLVSYGESEHTKWNDTIKNYRNPYWDGITFHRYEAKGKSLEELLKSTNTAIDNTVKDINNLYVSKMHNREAPIFIGELGVNKALAITETAYHGIFDVETILRAIKHPNIKYIGGHRLYGAYLNLGDNHELESNEKYQRNENVDVTKLDFDLFSVSSTVLLQVMDTALNNSSAYWDTTVTGGATVNKTFGSMPAVYAQSFKGDNGKDYVVIVNKSASTQSVTLNKKKGTSEVKLTNKLQKIFAYTTNPAVRNTANSKFNVKAVTENTENPVSIPPYSVTRVEWDSGRDQLLKNTYITHADITGTDKVTLKWMAADGAKSYNIKYGTEPGNYTMPVIATSDTSADITGLKKGTEYYFSVESADAKGKEKKMSENEANVKMESPDVPLMRRVFLDGSGKVGVEWQSVSRAAGYMVRYGTSPGNYTSAIYAGNELGTVISGLTNGQAYYFAVSAYNLFGESAFSKEELIYPNKIIPYAPNDVQINSAAADSVVLEWQQSYWEDYQGYFEDGDGTADGWTVNSGLPWSVVDHPDFTRKTKVFKSSGKELNIITRGEDEWQNYEIDAKVNVTTYESNGNVGLIGRFQDENNYYSFTYDNNKRIFSINKCVDGKTTVLKSAGAGKANDMRLIFRIKGNRLEGYVGKTVIVEAVDSTLSSGMIGLMSNQEAYFDEVVLRRPTTEEGSYILYRSTDPYAGFVEIARDIEDESYTDTTAAPGYIYYYKLKGVNSAGVSSGYSNIVTVKR